MLTDNFKKNIFIFIFISIFIFLVFKFKIFFIEPEVIIKNFENNNFLVTNNSIFLLEGKAEKSKKFYINNKEIFLNDRYQFSKKLLLSDYENIFYIKSISKTDIVFNKKISIFLDK
jgi:hypothetical protein